MGAAYFKHNGTWYDWQDLLIKNAGAWAPADKVYFKSSGVWTTIYDVAVPPPPPPPPPVVDPLVIGIAPSIVTGTRSGAGDVTSASTQLFADDGVPPYAYLWTYYSGDAVTIDSPNTAVTTFSATLTAGQSKAATIKGTVTDFEGTVEEDFVQVNLSAGYDALVASVSPASLTTTISGAGTATSNNVNVAVSGGTGAYNFSWAKLSGDTININNASGAITGFNATLTNGQTTNSVYRCTVTDTGGQSTFVDVTINLQSTYVPPYSVQASSSAISGHYSGFKIAFTSLVSAVITGGTAPFTYLWSHNLFNPTNATSATTKYAANYSGVATESITVTDALGNVAVGYFSVTFTGDEA